MPWRLCEVPRIIKVINKKEACLLMVKTDMSRLKTFICCLHLVCTLLARHLSMASQCPWEETGLRRWSDSATWPLGQKPGENAEVSVKKRLLLDESPPRLANLTVEAGGALIWANVDDILLQVSYIRVIGEFHMGSQSCPLIRRATISLYGNSISKYNDTLLGRKFLGVKSGGILELHGKAKTSWTKLAHTVPALSSVSCGFVYSHATSAYADENKVGLFVTSWYPDGAVFDFGSFDASTWMDLPAFLQKMPQGCVLAASVRSSLGVGSEVLFTSLEGLGAHQIRNVGLSDSYAFIVRMGDKTTALERLASGTQAPDTDYLHLSVLESNLTFSVRSSGTDVDFRVLASDLAFPIISLADDVSSWEPGDEVLITSTDYDWEQVEVRRILPCSACSKNQIRLDGTFENMHYGEVSQNVDMRAEVGLLTRNIKIQGIMEPQCYNFTDYEYLLCKVFQKDTFGGQIKALKGSTIHVEGVELYHMGQQAIVGSYPLHFHMMVEARGMWFRNNCIHHSFSRCATVHGSHNAEVSDNVCYEHLGHGYFLEDAVEQNTTLYRNLGVGTRYGMLTPGDCTADICKNLLKIPDIFCNDLSTFWLTHPNNNITNNVAAGSKGHGFGMIFADQPLTLSANVPELVASAPPNSSQYYSLIRFYGNVAHSNSLDGLFFDSKIASGGENYQGDVAPPNAVIPTTNNYDPRSPPNANGSRVWTQMERLTMYKNRRHNMWLKAGNIRVVKSSFADSPESFAGGNTGTDTGSEVRDSVFIGQTDNRGQPQLFVDQSETFSNLIEEPSVLLNTSFASSPFETVSGVSMYQGPMFVKNCFFDRFSNQWWADQWVDKYGSARPVMPMSAISFKRSNIYPSVPYMYTQDIKFGFCDNVNDGNWVFRGNSSVYEWTDDDGNLQATFRDFDGSVTGQESTQIVPNTPFFIGDKCNTVDYPNWNMVVCPYKYVQMEIVGSDGVLTRTNRVKSPLILIRDDQPTYRHVIQGTNRNTFLLRTNMSYTVNFNSTLGKVPTYFDIYGYGFEKEDVVRVGLCLPKTTTQFQVKSDFPVVIKNDQVMTSSLAALDADSTGKAFYFDKTTGLLFFKIWNSYNRSFSSQQCPGDNCFRVRIWRLDGGDGPTDCSSSTTPLIQLNRPIAKRPSPKPCKNPATAEGLGAVIPGEVVAAEPFKIRCPPKSLSTVRGTPEVRGCFAQKPVLEDVREEPLELLGSMTRTVCVDRCFVRGYPYAALTRGKRCTCGHSFGLYGPSNTCDVPCTGDSGSTCGGLNAFDVLATGFAPPPAPRRCGPRGSGKIYEDACLYLIKQPVTIDQAQRACSQYGGNLVSIGSSQKQMAVEMMLRDVDVPAAWTGLYKTASTGTWQFFDGTNYIPQTSFSRWKPANDETSSRLFVQVQSDQGFQWTNDNPSELASALCDIPISPTSPEPCGYNGAGRRLGPTGRCFLVLDSPVTTRLEAQYACGVAMGNLASVSNNTQDNSELTGALYRSGVEQNLLVKDGAFLWINGLYVYDQTSQPAGSGAVCVLDILNDSRPCGSAWQLFEQSCYLSLGTTVKTRSEASTLCEREYSCSRILSLDSEAEGTYIATLAPSSRVLLDPLYSQLTDEFVGSDGQTTSNSPWAGGQGKQNLSNGRCTVVSTSLGRWQNALCDQLTARLVCEAPKIRC